MISWFESRVRLDAGLYRVKTLYLFSFIPIYKRWEQLTADFIHSCPSER